MMEFIWLLTTNEQSATNAPPRCKVFSTRDKAQAYVDEIMLPKFGEGDSDYPSAKDGRWEANMYNPTDLLWRGKRPKSGETFFIFIDLQRIDSMAFYSEGFISETDAPYKDTNTR